MPFTTKCQCTTHNTHNHTLHVPHATPSHLNMAAYGSDVFQLHMDVLSIVSVCNQSHHARQSSRLPPLTLLDHEEKRALSTINVSASSVSAISVSQVPVDGLSWPSARAVTLAAIAIIVFLFLPY